ncbi:hypothetical protein [Glaciihabitans sp. GrIS 2.15]|uniref:hypothetical protein n=1 Tax=Glaciihabitans sp. GrIS 2.15 TaxID=3071710 RepID=UPI00199BD747|nr:hypothetical protein [Microbacteriaceae bacterium]MEC5168819.1 hypothetical protein [Glaciihabitans sp. GrIS 2.15]
MIAQVVLWIFATVVIAAALATSITAIRFHKPSLALLAAIPVIAGLVGLAFRSGVPAPSNAVAVVAGILLALLGIVAGSPITIAVLGFSSRGTSRPVDGQHGGIVVNEGIAPEVHRAEVLRGGTIIGYLERLALIAAIVLGHLEIVAVLIAVKGLGRFSELDSPEIRERFIIGTLVSLVWAGACALLIVL